MLLDGKQIASKVETELKEKIDLLKNKRVPCLVVIQVGNNPASTSYVKSKTNACERVGITTHQYKLDEETEQNEIEDLIKALNENNEVDAILLQLPLPKHLNERYLMDLISPNKDVDGFGYKSIQGIFNDEDTILPCTPKGILRLLDEYNIPTDGKNVVVLGRSTIVGKPIGLLMLSKKRNATVTLCHSHSENLEEITRKADILIAAIGSPLFVKKDMVKDNIVIIDVGINRIADSTKKSGFRLVGDVDKETYKKASYYTPVPGGVGPMTVAMLLENTYELYKKWNG